jgi:hypothetical protein
MQDNLGGDFKEFQSAYEAVGTDLFDQQESSLRKLVQTATGYVLKLDKWIQRNKGSRRRLASLPPWRSARGYDRGIGLIAWPVITGLMPSSPLRRALGTVFTTVAGASLPLSVRFPGRLSLSWRRLSPGHCSSVNIGSPSAHFSAE